MATIDTASTGTPPRSGGITREERKVIFASSLGTVFEWYDFYLYGSLAAIIAKHFFAGVNETTAFIFALLAFAAGFAVRPFGAIVFGRLGDMIGRKHTFLITIVIMGVSTAIVGLLPGYATIGVAAPVILITLRLLQGLALGGEYGGAATYVAEHAPRNRRGFFTSWIQTTATLGLFMSLLVILACRTALGTEAFEAWGWRIPFLLSIILLAVSVYIRLQLSESPVFQKMKDEGKASKAPLTESFARWDNLKVVIMSLLGGTAGQAVVWYTGQFYALFFLLQTLKIDAQTANLLIAGSLLIGTPFFVIFGSLSDRIGRKPIIMAGCLLAALTYFPIFHALTQYGNPDVFVAQEKNPVKVIANPDQCSFQFDPVGKAKFTSSCDLAKTLLAKRAIPYENVAAEPNTVAQVRIGDRVVESFEGSALPAADFKTRNDAFTANLAAALKDAGYPEKADPAKINYPMMLLLLTVLVIYVTMVYGPIAAWLVELFPTRIRYTSMSLPYHIGNGWFGGFLPTVAFAMVAATGDIYYGLWYPIVIAVATAILGTFFLPETKDRDILKD
ncbi:MFS family permease [Pseudomonas sp. EB276 TE3739]|jgi:MFS family permease|uniref:Major facilitator transporter n=1 Tax=Pseudomonas fluorescens TaxID=294 RepID=A0AAE2DYL4_PSEFL|nr:MULTISPECIES: MFS transporter [Pseudomonas]KIP97204.1 major facilitator transporter [Pseudomonas fluorescens]MCP1476477.1 MFS family permease [Pseudomonas koreensis]MDR6161818.1 MFS family permease [Pseudomonas fluorescens]MED7670615.1 MHS family MFS transporter [Pseudomonas moraviensis subsp. stanleyae]UEB93668.1 MHS family MFS transporter [Pseudomonas sp. HN2]